MVTFIKVETEFIKVKTERVGMMKTLSITTYNNQIINWLGIITIVLVLSSCASLGTKFNATTEADVNVFADTTMAMLKEANFGFSKGEALYTREFYDLEEPEEKKLGKSVKESENVLYVMLKYSLELVAITDAQETAEGQIQAYADYLSDRENTLASLPHWRNYIYLPRVTRPPTKNCWQAVISLQMNLFPKVHPQGLI